MIAVNPGWLGCDASLYSRDAVQESSVARKQDSVTAGGYASFIELASRSAAAAAGS